MQAWASPEEGPQRTKLAAGKTGGRHSSPHSNQQFTHYGDRQTGEVKSIRSPGWEQDPS